MASKYVKVTARMAGGVRHTMRLLVTKDDGRHLCGWIVDKEGERQNVFVALDYADIIKRTPLRMNPHYAKSAPAVLRSRHSEMAWQLVCCLANIYLLSSQSDKGAQFPVGLSTTILACGRNNV